MSLPDRNNPYSFQEFLEWREKVDYYADDPFIQKVLKHYIADEKEWERVDQKARELSPVVSQRFRKMADAIARPEKQPFILHYDAFNNRIDRIVRPKETEIMEKEIFSLGLFSSRTSLWERLIKMYLIYQNGEACIACPLTCTEGLVALLEKYADTPELKRILTHCKEGIDGDFGIGAQYLSEIQGGSDVPANLLEAVKENGFFRLYGTKFFCSATHADYALVTAKPQGSEKIGLFLVPSWLPGNKEKEIRNNFTIDRIKWKLGTSELTTAEITFNGAVAYPVGPLDRGLANMVGIVLTYSRLTVGLSSAASMTRAAREALKYAEFREAFGRKIGMFPLLAYQLKKIDRAAKRTTAAAFKIYKEFLSLPEGLKGGLITDEPEPVRQKRFEVRELIMLQKITAAKDATEILHTAMSVFGGHGVIEDFSSLPRLYRDSNVNELWEGPRNVLLTQIYRDLKRAASWYAPEKFVDNLLKGGESVQIKELKEELSFFLSYPDIYTLDDKTIEMAEKWDLFCDKLFHTYQDIALDEIRP